MTCSDFRNQAVLSAKNYRANHADIFPFLDEGGYCLECAIRLIRQKVGVQRDGQWKTLHVFRWIFGPQGKGRCSNICEPKHCAGMDNTEGILDTGSDWHLSDDA
jgi:hypothetical protein